MEHAANIATRDQVIAYLLVRLKCLGRVKMMKLPYLADLEHMRRYGRPLSEARYMRDTFGAVDYQILDTAEAMPAVRVEPVTTFFGKPSKDYYATDSLADPSDSLTLQAQAVLDFVVEQYGCRTGTWLGKLTKTTEPWKDAEQRRNPVLHLEVVAPSDKLSHLRDVLKRVDRSTFGTPEDLAKRDAMVEESMAPYRLRALGE